MNIEIKIKTAIALLLISSISFAQNNVWMASGVYKQLKITFPPNSGDPTVELIDKFITSYETSSTLSSINNEMILYTNGGDLYDKNFNITPNGSGLIGAQESQGNPNGSNPQGGVFINKPGNDNQFYLLTAGDAYGPGNGIRYNLVDITLPGNGTVEFPLGDIVDTVKNKIIQDGQSPGNLEGLTFYSKNCDTTWLITHHGNSNGFGVYPITKNGFGDPVISFAGDTIQTIMGRGEMAINSQGNKIALVTGTKLQLFDFNLTTGEIIHHKKFAINGGYSCLWSNNSENLFISGSMLQAVSFIYQPEKDTLIQSNLGFGGLLRMGPNNKIYTNPIQGSGIGCISNPETTNIDSMSFETIALTSPGFSTMLGLQTIHISPFYGKINNCNSVQIFNSTDTIISNIQDDPYLLTSTPAGGKWYLNGVKVNNGYINPSVLGPGLKELIYEIDGTNKTTVADTAFVQIQLTTSDKNRIGSLKSISIFPNPSEGIANLSFNGNQKSTGNFSIFNQTGKLCLTADFTIKKGENKLNIDLLNLDKGVYFIKIEDSISHEFQTKKLIVK